MYGTVFTTVMLCALWWDYVLLIPILNVSSLVICNALICGSVIIIRHLELLFVNAGPPTKFPLRPEPCVQLSFRLSMS